MENPGSSIISSLGAGSGVDFIELANDLSDATYAFQRDNLAARNEALEARISSAAVLRSSLTQLSSALGDRMRSGDLAPRATIGNPSVANVSTTSGIVPNGSYSLEVTQLAQGQTLASNVYGSGSDLVGEGNLTIRFGTVDGASFTEDSESSALDIAVAADDTLQSLAAKISAQSDGRVEAYVASGTDGAQLVFKGEDGAANGFVFEATSAAAAPTDAPGDLTYLNWNPATDGGALRQSAQDAEFLFDTIAMRSSSNTVSGLPEGIGLTLSQTNIGVPTSISFSSNTAGITAVMSDFVTALNDLTGQLGTEAAAFGGTLGNDAGARELKRDLARLTNETIMPGAEEGEPSTLADLGLQITREGNFEFDSERLSETLAANLGATAAMFTTGPFGVFATMDRLARANTLRSNPGSLGGSLVRYEAQIERNEERLTKIADQQENLRSRLTTQLVAAERRIAGSQSTLSFLQQQINVWNDGN